MVLKILFEKNITTDPPAGELPIAGFILPLGVYLIKPEMLILRNQDSGPCSPQKMTRIVLAATTEYWIISII